MSATNTTADGKEIPDFRKEMKTLPGGGVTVLGEPLIKIDLPNLDATARWPSVMHMAVLHVFAKQLSKDRHKSASLLILDVEEQYGRKSIGYKGKAREEYGTFANNAAIGGGGVSLNGADAQQLLMESGARNAGQVKKAHWYSRGKK